MKFSAIAFITISLILPIKANCRPEAAPNRQRAQIDATCFRMALTYSDGGFKANQPDSAAIRWHKRANSATLKAVALVIHGLNCRPDKMESIIAELTARGIDCLNLSLRGHGENYTPIENKTSADARMEAFKRVSYALWKSETYQAYKHIKKRSNQYQVPLFFVGFSMGGLLGVDLLASNPEVKFDKMVLFAPALKMRTRNHLLKIFSLFPSLVIPSMAHTSYLANSGTPMAAYNALFDMYQHFEKNPDPKINIPTIVFIDEQDELISFSGLQEMVRDQNLDKWKIHLVQKDRSATEIKMHHIIIDEASVGKQMWKKIVATTIAHFLGGQSAGTIDE